MNAHLQHFLVISTMFTVKDVSPMLFAFAFPVLTVTKAQKGTLTTWVKCDDAFLTKFFPLGETSALQNKIISFQQLEHKSILDIWGHFLDYLMTHPHRGMEYQLLIWSFYHGVNCNTYEHLDTAVAGTFLSLSVRSAKALIEQMVPNQG